MTYTLLGKDNATGERIEVSQSTRREGLYIIGASGTGKSTLIESLLLQDITQGLGVCLLDPHGDLTTSIISKIDKHLDDVILLDVANDAYPFGLNLFACPYPQDIRWVQYTVNQVMHIFDRLYDISRATPNMSYFLRNCTYTIIANLGYTMAEIPMLLTNDAFRKRLVANVRDAQVLNFWAGYERIVKSAYQYQQTVLPILNKLDEFLQPMLRNIVGQSKSTIDLRKIMDERKLLFLKLDPRLEDMTTLIGSVIVAQILNAAYSRGELDQNKRKQFNLYVDEFEWFAGQDFMQLVSEARKFGIGTTVSNQTLSQITDAVKENILQAATLVVFRVSGQDGKELATEFSAVPPAAETRREPIRTPILEPIQYMVTKGVHPLENTRTFIEKYGKRLVELAKLEEEVERDSRREYNRYEHDLVAGARYIAPPLIRVTHDSRTTLTSLNSLFYKSMKAGKEGKNADDIPLPYGLVDCFIRALVPEKSGYQVAMTAYNDFLLQHTMQPAVDRNSRIYELRNRLADLPAHRQTEIVPRQTTYTTVKQEREQVYRKLLLAEPPAVREHCVIVKKGSVYYNGRLERPSWDGTPSQTPYFLQYDNITPPIRFSSCGHTGEARRILTPYLEEFIPYRSWEDVVNLYCEAFQDVWFQVAPTLRDKNCWQQQRRRVRCKSITYKWDREHKVWLRLHQKDTEYIEEMEVWILEPGIEQAWYTNRVLEAEIITRLDSNIWSSLNDFLPHQIVNELTDIHHKVGLTQLELQKVTNEVAAEVAQETQKIQQEIRLLEQVETEKKIYDPFVIKFEGQMRQIMRELAAAPIEQESGQWEEKPLAPRPIADIEAEVAKMLSSPTQLPTGTAYVKTPTGEHKITIDRSAKGVNRTELQQRMIQILGWNLDDGYIRNRADVEAEIFTRQLPPDEPPQPAKPSTQPTAPQEDTKQIIPPPPIPQAVRRKPKQ